VQSTPKDAFLSLDNVLFEMHVQPALKYRLEEARVELEKLEFDREQDPRTENPDFVIQSLRAKNWDVWRIVTQALNKHNKDAPDPDLWESPDYLAKATKLASMSDRQDMDAAQLMTDMLIYYKVSLVALRVFRRILKVN
jgi:DNA-directed RNA polymerase subunit H (RpoH/RPB5)